MTFDPGKKWLEPVLLCSPEQSFPVLGVVAMFSIAVLLERSVVEETFAADPAHYWWRSYGEAGQLCGVLRVIIVSAGAHAFPICRHSVCCQLDVFAADLLGKVLLAACAFEVGQETEGWSEQHWALSKLRCWNEVIE